MFQGLNTKRRVEEGKAPKKRTQKLAVSHGSVHGFQREGRDSMSGGKRRRFQSYRRFSSSPLHVAQFNWANWNGRRRILGEETGGRTRIAPNLCWLIQLNSGEKKARWEGILLSAYWIIFEFDLLFPWICSGLWGVVLREKKASNCSEALILAWILLPFSCVFGSKGGKVVIFN